MMNRSSDNEHGRSRAIKFYAALTGSLLAFVLSLSSPCALAAFSTFHDEAAWRVAAGPTALEDFESFIEGTQIHSLPKLHLAFDELAGGGFPQAYLFGGTPYGPMHLGNFPNGINAINRFNDIIARPTNNFQLHSLGFWNGDGQADTYFVFAYGANGQLLGSVGAFKDTFAGFVSDEAVSFVRFDGHTGDGWDHLDGLQVNVPEPSTFMLMILGILTVAAVAHGMQKGTPRSDCK